MNSIQKIEMPPSVQGKSSSDALNTLKELSVAQMPVAVIEQWIMLLKVLRTWEAEQEYQIALCELQGEIPEVDKNGRIEIRAKDQKGERTGKVLQSTHYARWEDINRTMKPFLRKHGFTYQSNEEDLKIDGVLNVRVISTLGHNGGHKERSTCTLPYDTTGSKNTVQSGGSARTYAHRYNAVALLNITVRDDDTDDDGEATSIPPTTISEAEQIELEGRAGPALGRFLKYMGIEALAELPSDRLQEARNALDQMDQYNQKKAQRKGAKS